MALVFGVNGFAMASWASRLPAIRDDLHLSTGHLGLVLLAMSVGSVSMLPFSGVIVRGLGAARTATVASAAALTGLVLIGRASAVWALALGLWLTGSGVGAWDVAMNVEGAEVERRSGRAIMPRFHAAFSLGTVFGAGIGALAAGESVPVGVHLPVVAVLVLALTVVGVRSFLPADSPVGVPADPMSTEPAGVASAREVPPPAVALSAWLETTTLLIGVLVFSMALAEGAANDWLALAVVDGYGAVHATGALIFGLFVTGMTAMRLAGTVVLDRFDHVRVVRVSAALVLLGTGLVVLGSVLAGRHATPFDYVLAGTGALAWGIGAALGFPMGMTAAAADPRRSAARLAVVSTVGYTAFLAGPPLLGALGQQVGIARSLLGVSVAVLLAIAVAGVLRQPGRGGQPGQPAEAAT